MCDLVRRTPLTVAQWKKQRSTYANGRLGMLKRGFATLYLNRCNRSGILGAGLIGGLKQDGPWKMDARFNRSALCGRIERIAEYGERVRIVNRDARDVIRELGNDENVLFVDPSYYHKGQKLYLNALDAKYHTGLAALLRKRKDAAWVMTYDDCPEVRALYRDWARVRPFSLRYSAAQRRRAGELLIVPRWMQVPTAQDSGEIDW